MSFERFSDEVPVLADLPAIEGTSAAQTDGPTPTWPKDGDARIDQVFAELERLEQSERPEALGEQEWYQLLRDLRHFAEKWLDIALACGWELRDLFGSPARLEHRRQDLRGAALVLGGRNVESIDAERIVIANRIGPPNVFYRRAPGSPAPFDRSRALMIWNLVKAGSL